MENMNVWSGEGNRPEIKKANLGMRIGAFIIDHIIIITAFLVPLVLFAFKNTFNNSTSIFNLFPVFMVMVFLVYCLKDCVGGASIGKRVLGLAVRKHEDPSEVPTVPRLFMRNILTFLWLVEFLVLVISEDKTKIGDKIAKTDVYRLEKKVKIPAIIITAIAAVFVSIASLLFGVVSFIKNDSSYQSAQQYIEASTEISDVVGNIEGYGVIPSGSVSYSGGYGQAEYMIKVIGERDTVYVDIQMEKNPNQDWTITYFDYGR